MKHPVINPATNAVISHVNFTTADEFNEIVSFSKKAQVSWAQTPVKDRVQVFYKLKHLMEENLDHLASLIEQENGKTKAESIGSIQRGLECVEFATSLPQLIGGQCLEVGNGIECKLVRQPLGVVAGITPFNFPLMVPLWMIPLAISCGNSFILKPSEQTPLSGIELGKLLTKAGLPDGVFNVVHGDKSIVEAICDHLDISAIGFIGSTKVAKIVYDRAAVNGKRIRSLGGAKNHLVLLPDADPEMAATNIVASVTGCAGQRCMAASVLLAVGDVDSIIDRVKSKMSEIIPGNHMGPVINQAAKDRICRYLENAEASGAKLILDGRNTHSAGNPNGFYLGASIIDHANPNDAASCDEIFGPTLTIIRCNTLDEALEIENNNPYGNAAAVYTSSGKAADEFAKRANSGMIGINIGVPVPREPFPFGGWNDSRFGDGDLTGPGAIDFWTKSKKITTKWVQSASTNWMS